MIPLSDIIARIRLRYETESGGAASRYSTADIQGLVNDAVEVLAEGSRFWERYISIPMIEGQSFYDLRGFTPDTVVTIKSVWNNERNEWLLPDEEKNLGYRWAQAAGQPERYFVRGAHWIGVFPHPSATAGYLRVHFSGIPSPLNYPQAVLSDLPDNHIEALVSYCLYEMAALDRQTDMAINYFQDYQTREKQLHDYIDRRLVGARAGRFGVFAG